jgi:hypothetical protein
VRHAERRVHRFPAGPRYVRLRNPASLSAGQRSMLQRMPQRHLKTTRAFQIRLRQMYE